MCHGYNGDAKTVAASFLKPKPRSFMDTSVESLSRDKMLRAVREGRSGTAMKPFSSTLSASEIEDVVDFIRHQFMKLKKPNSRYHTAENGWPDHNRYAIAFPFVFGDLKLSTPTQDLSPSQRSGRKMFMESCVSCHDNVEPDTENLPWTSRPLSFPRTGYDHVTGPKTDAVSGATPYSVHDKRPQLRNPTASMRRGEEIFQSNCAFCHAADGSGKNWIGQFLQPPARDLSRVKLDREALRQTIQNGLPGTTMPAWRDVLNEDQLNDLLGYLFAAILNR